MRGTGLPIGRERLRRRFIPACAGNRQLSFRVIIRLSVHPRVCGEQNIAAAVFSCNAGSSPRVRGTELGGLLEVGRVRFIPACAGNRLRIGCGRVPESGSSPRVRGTGCERASCPPCSTVHPRVCGEQPARSGELSHGSGSSPRVRGTAVPLPYRLDPVRFIPACAGNRPCAPGAWPTMPVHPRVCGEQQSTTLLGWLSGGSSPRVRGTVIGLVEQLAEIRFIPACAGNSTSVCRSLLVPPVHPRVCGEQTCSGTNSRFASGSSPRVRGTGIEAHPRESLGRFIPACAGNSVMLLT